jgi:ATP-dependent DNA helicase RecG
LINNATEVLGVEPVYRLNSGLTQNKLVKILDVALEVAEELKILPESLPNDVLEDLGWPSFVDAIKTAHRPATMAEAGVESPARNQPKID